MRGLLFAIAFLFIGHALVVINGSRAGRSIGWAIMLGVLIGALWH